MAVSDSRPRVLFLWETSAGHEANLRRLKPLLEAHPDLDARVEPIPIWDPDGPFEKVGLGAIPARLRPSLRYRRLVTSERWDAIHTSSRGLRGNLHRVRSMPMVMDHDVTPSQLDDMPEYGMRRRGPAWIRDLADRRKVRAAARISTWSSWSRDGFVDAGADPERVVVNPPGVELDVWTPVSGDAPRADDERIRIVFVGGDLERKGGLDLIEWFRTQQDPRFELHLVTPADVTPVPGMFVHRLREHDPRLHELVRTAHVSVLPSRAECFGLVSIEAIASGTPVIQSDVGGASDIVRHGRTGLLVPPADQRAFDSALHDLLSDPARYDAMRIEARADAVRRFGIERNVDTTVDLVHEAIAERRSGLAFSRA
ncbi:MAG: glycosyltransferase family 4 protein [Actinomycetota bacterium]